jgi:hypothetical protein
MRSHKAERSIEHLEACVTLKPSNGLTCCPIVELRQYTLRAQQRDILINLFDTQIATCHRLAGCEGAYFLVELSFERVLDHRIR